MVYQLFLRGQINTPVNLFFSYTEVVAKELEGEREPRVANRTALTTYNSTDAITHVEFRSQVPFPRFRVGVALMNGFLRGPINQTAESYGKWVWLKAPHAIL